MQKRQAHTKATTASRSARCSSEAPFLFQIFRQEKQSEHQQQHAKRDCSSQWPVVGCPEQADHDVRDHNSTRSAQKEWRQKVAEAKHERKRCSGQNSRDRKRKNHAPESLKRRCPEIMRRIDEIPWNVLKRSIDRQKRKWRIDMSQ